MKHVSPNAPIAGRYTAQAGEMPALYKPARTAWAKR